MKWIRIHSSCRRTNFAEVRHVNQLLMKQFPKYNNRSFEIITGNETWVYFYFFPDLEIEIAESKGKCAVAKFYKGYIIHKLKASFANRRPAIDLPGVRLWHDFASSHKAVVVRKYLIQDSVVKIPRPSLYAGPCPL